MGITERRKDSFFIMDTTRWLSLLFAVLTYITPALSAEPRVVCYYTNWSVYRPGTAKFNPQNINPYLCTHLIYAFGGFTKENTLKPFDKYQDIEKGGYAKFTGLKTYNKNLKTLLAIGGWNEGSARFSPMVASRDRRKEFARNAIKFLRQNRFDGLDLDWEYPAFRDGGKPKDRENYAKLVKELREEFDRESEKTGKPRLLLTMAVPAGIEYIQKGFDVKTLNQYLDWMNLLTYDYHSAFEPAVNHHSPLYPLEEPNEYSVDNELNIDYTIKFYLESGADADKLVLGIPTYGRSYTLFNGDATEIGAPADGPGDQGDATREKGYLAYYEICEALKPKDKVKRASSDEDSDEDSEEEDEPWTVVQPNAKAMGPYAYKGNQWVGYDDIDIVKKKAEYVAENGLGGIMFWSIDNDDFRGSCHDKPYPLIEAAKEAYIENLELTDNAVTSKPRQVTTSRSSRRKSRPRASTTTARPTTKSTKRKSSEVKSTTPTWNNTPEPPTTPDPGSDFKCTDEGFFPHPRDCKKYFWCLDSGPSNLGIVAHQFTCPSGLYFNKAADSCDFARNVLCKKPAATTKPPATKAPTTQAPTTTTRKPIKLATKSSHLFRTTTTTTPEPEVEESVEDSAEDAADIEAEDPKVIKELIDLIKKVGGVEQLEKQLHLTESGDTETTTRASFNKKLYQKVLERARGKTKSAESNTVASSGHSRRGPQNAGLEASADRDKAFRKDRPQYTTIQRSRPLSPTPDPLENEESEEDIQIVKAQRGRAVEEKVATTAKPLQYVNIRRARPTSDTADDSASRNALFERPESFVAVSESSFLDVNRRDNMPEYVTIRRQRPTTEEATTAQYQVTEEAEEQDTALEREISSPQTQPQYTSIVRNRPSTSPPEDITTQDPTTVLAVQIASLLNEAELTDDETDTTIAEATEADATTTTTTTTTQAPTRRTILRRRGSTTTTSTTSTPTPTINQTAKRPFLRRVKPTSSATPSASPSTTDNTETTTNKYSRRPAPKFRTRQNTAEKDAGNDTRPSLNGNAVRSERPRNFARRRPSGANVTTSSPAPSTTVSRRPFRVASRRRPASTTAAPTTTTDATTAVLSEESLQDIGDTDFIEDPSLQERTPKVPKAQRRPLLLKEDDQNPSATNDDERKKTNKNLSGEDDKKRQSKKYSASFKQNQLDEVLRQKTKSQEEFDVTTEGRLTTIDDYSAETALAIAAHQLLAAPLPSIPNYDDETPKRSSTRPTKDKHSTFTEQYTDSYSSTPLYQTTVQNYIQTSTGDIITAVYDVPRTTTYLAPKLSTYSTSPLQSRTSKPSGFTTYSNLDSTLTSTLTPFTETSYSGPTRSEFSSRTPEYVSRGSKFSTGPTRSSDYTTDYSSTSTLASDTARGRSTSRYSVSSTLRPFEDISSTVDSSTARFLSRNKLIPVPVEDYSLAPEGYSSVDQEPSYFTRDYLLESPVTKTYDDEYQYLSPVTTTPQPTTRKIKKTVYRKISTTQRPTVEPLPVSTPKPKPRKVATKKPFEKVLPKNEAKYKSAENYDYYDEGHEKIVNKYAEGTKVVLHARGTIECLDIGNFPHPGSCKKFISCARLENGSLLGWEYICPKGLSFDPVGGICNWSAGLGCEEKEA